MNSSTFLRIWLATFVAAGTYGLISTALLALIVGSAVVGAVTIDVLWSSIAALLALLLLTMASLFIVPLVTKSLVRSIARVRVGFAWVVISVIVGWVVVTALSTLLWLIPGAQPFAALLVWAGATALTAWLLEKRAKPLAAKLAPPTSPEDAVTKSYVDGVSSTELL